MVALRRAAAGGITLALLIVACGPSGPQADGRGDLVHERVVVDGVTVARNVSGSVWGRPAALVPFAEIGGDGDDYYFSFPSAIWSADNRIVVSDPRAGVRAYDRSGRLLCRYGRLGQGPGEHDGELLIAAVDASGIVYILTLSKVMAFSRNCELVREWSTADMPAPSGGGFWPGTDRLIAAPNGGIHIPLRRPERDRYGPYTSAWVRLGVEGWGDEPVVAVSSGFERPTFAFRCPWAPDGVCVEPTRFGPEEHVLLRRDGSILRNVPDRYRFEIRHPDGTVLAVKREVEPAPVTPREVRVIRAGFAARLAEQGIEVGRDVPELADHKPAIARLRFTARGNPVVFRETTSDWNEANCGPEEAWTPETGPYDCLHRNLELDFFTRDGRFLGTVPRPRDARVATADLGEDEIWAWAFNPAGEIVLRGYRLVVPTQP